MVENELSYFDLNHQIDTFNISNSVVLRLAGNQIKEIIKVKDAVSITIKPVGLTLIIPYPFFSEEIFYIEKDLDIIMKKSEINWENIVYGIEAGPMLVNDGKLSIDMERDGWKSNNSIRTQAARIDYTDMRGPKIAIGIDEKGSLMVVTINGRIRESVGATHYDMAEILIEQGMKKGMGFDPGGSSTLVVDNKILNISPYNKNYEIDNYSLPPEPRFVSNIIFGISE